MRISDLLIVWALQQISNAAIILPCPSGRGAVRLARLHGVQEVGGSNPLAPTNTGPLGHRHHHPAKCGGVFCSIILI